MALHPGEAQTIKCPTMTEVVLKDPGQFPRVRVDHHRTLAGNLFAANPPRFRSYYQGYMESAPVTEPNTVKVGAEMMCGGCPAKEICKPIISIQPDKRIVIQGSSVDTFRCNIPR